MSLDAFCNVILSIKQIGSEKLDFSLFGQNIYYSESFAPPNSNTNIASIISPILQTKFNTISVEYFSISLSYSVGVYSLGE